MPINPEKEADTAKDILDSLVFRINELEGELAEKEEEIDELEGEITELQEKIEDMNEGFIDKTDHSEPIINNYKING